MASLLAARTSTQTFSDMSRGRASIDHTRGRGVETVAEFRSIVDDNIRCSVIDRSVFICTVELAL